MSKWQNSQNSRLISTSREWMVPGQSITGHGVLNKKKLNIPPDVITSNQNETDQNQTLCVVNGIHTNGQYRKYMQDNANAILKHNLNEYSQSSLGHGLSNSSTQNAVTWTTHIPNTGTDSIGKLGERSKLLDMYLEKQQIRKSEYEASMQPPMTINQVRSLISGMP